MVQKCQLSVPKQTLHCEDKVTSELQRSVTRCLNVPAGGYKTTLKKNLVSVAETGNQTCWSCLSWKRTDSPVLTLLCSKFSWIDLKQHCIILLNVCICLIPRDVLYFGPKHPCDYLFLCPVSIHSGEGGTFDPFSADV